MPGPHSRTGPVHQAPHHVEVLPKILVVDDSLTMRSAIRRELGTDRCEIIEAANGLEALELLDKGLVPALVTLDVEMPKLDGFATCEALYGPRYAKQFANFPNGRVPVVFITASNTLEERRRGFELGAIDFIPKNFDPGRLSHLIFRQLRPNDRLRGVNVLLVDDSSSVRTIVGKALREEGVSVTEAEDGNRAFEILCNRMSETDLVITDIAMPGLDGHALCRRIRHELGLTELPVVFFTGTDQDQRLRAFASGATDCLTKPFIKEEMVARLLVHLEKVQLHRRLHRTVSELRTALQWQSEMLATLSHDMRAPLNGIMGFSELLLGEPKRPAEEKENLEMIQQSGHLLLALIDDVLTLARQESRQSELELRPVVLDDLIRRSVGNLRHLAKLKEQHLTLKIAVPGVVVMGHAEALIRVFNNLLSNAVKFTPAQGRIAIEITGSDPDQVVITVTDTGIGMSPEKLILLFDRYTRVSRPGTSGETGTGLGMSIVKEFVDLHRGQISVTSQPGEGTRFRITLPRTNEAPTAANQPLKAPETHKYQLCRRMAGLRILIAEDNPVNQTVTRTILVNAGCSVHIATNGREALTALLATAAPEFDVVLMDMEMPGMDGVTTTRTLRAAGLNKLPIIGLTGNDLESDRAKCMLAGMNAFLVKPFNPTALFEIVLHHVEPLRAQNPGG